MRVSNDDVNPEMPIFHSFTGLFRVFQEIALFLLEIAGGGERKHRLRPGSADADEAPMNDHSSAWRRRMHPQLRGKMRCGGG
jgi:hypothetical protein